MSSEIELRPTMSARQFLATPPGAALRARVGTRFLGQIGTVMDLIDLVKSIAGGAPGMSIEDLLNNHSELLEEILRRQAEMSQEIGGIGDSLQGIGGSVDQIRDLVGQVAEGNEEARRMLDAILAE